MKKPQRPLFIFYVVFSIVAFVCSSSCYSKKPYVHNGTDSEIELVSSEYHDFSYVKVKIEDNQLVVYGMLKHYDPSSGLEAHVDFFAINSAGDVVSHKQLIVQDRGTRRKGWRGAHFREKFDADLPSIHRIKLVLHDPQYVIERHEEPNLHH